MPILPKMTVEPQPDEEENTEYSDDEIMVKGTNTWKSFHTVTYKVVPRHCDVNFLPQEWKHWASYQET